MELYAEILSHYLSTENAQIIFPDLKLNTKEIIELQCYRTLNRIKDIIHDDSLTGEECFLKIEEMIVAFEEIGSNGGDRHDFG